MHTKQVRQTHILKMQWATKIELWIPLQSVNPKAII